MKKKSTYTPSEKTKKVIDRVMKDFSGVLSKLDDYPKELFLRCSCGSEVLHFVGEYIDNRILEMDVCIFKFHNHSSKLDWKNRFRWIWNIVITGKPYDDQIVLDKESVKKLKEYLNNFSL